MGAALLGLSGWFITATGLAGLAGVGIAFDVFRPSAGVRFLALGRAAARYGERLLTHDATLRALASLRVLLLRGYARLDAKGLMRLRGESALTRIISDVDALDGVILRLFLPALAGIITHLTVFLALGWIVGWPVALAILAGYLPAAILILVVLARRSITPSAQSEQSLQDLRRGMIDAIRDRAALILAGQLPAKEGQLTALDSAARAASADLDRADRDGGALLSILVAGVAMGVFVTGAYLLAHGVIGPAAAVIGLFVALALAEVLMPLRRGMSDLGRMVTAARRVQPDLTSTDQIANGPVEQDAPLLRLSLPRVSGDFHAGQAIVLTGPSGVGKSTLLLQIAGLLPADGIAIKGRTQKDWPESDLRAILTMLPQRSNLIAGTLRDNLSLAGEFDDDALRAVLDIVALSDVVNGRDGLDLRLGEGGSGLSGGQARRVALARSVLKKPDILLLDEPTEGLDDATADLVLHHLRAALPNSLIIAAIHRGADHPVFDARVALTATN